MRASTSMLVRRAVKAGIPDRADRFILQSWDQSSFSAPARRCQKLLMLRGCSASRGPLLRSNRQDVRLIYPRASGDLDTSARQRGVSAYHLLNKREACHGCIERPVPPCPARPRSVYRYSTSGTPERRTSHGSSTDREGKEGPRPIHRSVAPALCPIHRSVAAALCGPAEIDIPDLHQRDGLCSL